MKIRKDREDWSFLMSFRKFEDIDVWKNSRELVNKVYIMISNNQSLQKDYSLSDQFKRASYSIMLNIAEGFEKGTKKEFARSLNIAKGSAGEVRAILHIIKDNHFLSEESYRSFMIDVENISAQLFCLRRSIINQLD